MKTGKLVKLSEEQLVDCDGTSDPESGRADCGVFGGWPYLAYKYIIKAGGIDPAIVLYINMFRNIHTVLVGAHMKHHASHVWLRDGLRNYVDLHRLSVTKLNGRVRKTEVKKQLS